MMQTTAIADDITREPSSLLDISGAKPQEQLTFFPTATFSISQLLWVHRLVTDETRLPYAQRGHFRTVGVWVGPVGVKPEEARFVPPLPEEIHPKIEALSEDWRNKYSALLHVQPENIIENIAMFHHGFLSIHPFLDANGRVARSVLQQQALELLHRNIIAKFTSDPEIYYDTLHKADQGDMKPLTTLIQSCLE